MCLRMMLILLLIYKALTCFPDAMNEKERKNYWILDTPMHAYLDCCASLSLTNGPALVPMVERPLTYPALIFFLYFSAGSSSRLWLSLPIDGGGLQCGFVWRWNGMSDTLWWTLCKGFHTLLVMSKIHEKRFHLLSGWPVVEINILYVGEKPRNNYLITKCHSVCVQLAFVAKLLHPLTSPILDLSSLAFPGPLESWTCVEEL